VSVTDHQTAPYCDNAGYYEMRNEQQMHKRCAYQWDNEQPKKCIDCDLTFTGVGRLCSWCFRMVKL
jgi:hypothetical protein